MIKEINKSDLKQALDLVNNVFCEFVAVDYSEQGISAFKNYLEIKYNEISSDLQTGHKKLWGYYENGKIIGVIATRDISHIALMFVNKQHHRKGIGRQLFDTVLAELKDNIDITKVTVNSSPYAVKIYDRLGFRKTDEQQEKDGIKYVPMAYLLKIKELKDNQFSITISTFPNKDTAKAAAKILIEKRLAACVQLFPVESVYIWQGNICDENEVMLFIKSKTEQFDKIAAAIKEIHTYEVPEIIQVPIINGSPDYLKWIENSGKMI